MHRIAERKRGKARVEGALWVRQTFKSPEFQRDLGRATKVNRIIKAFFKHLEEGRVPLLDNRATWNLYNQGTIGCVVLKSNELNSSVTAGVFQPFPNESKAIAVLLVNVATPLFESPESEWIDRIGLDIIKGLMDLPLLAQTLAQDPSYKSITRQECGALVVMGACTNPIFLTADEYFANAMFGAAAKQKPS